MAGMCLVLYGTVFVWQCVCESEVRACRSIVAAVSHCILHVVDYCICIDGALPTDQSSHRYGRQLFTQASQPAAFAPPRLGLMGAVLGSLRCSRRRAAPHSNFKWKRLVRKLTLRADAKSLFHEIGGWLLNRTLFVCTCPARRLMSSASAAYGEGLDTEIFLAG